MKVPANSRVLFQPEIEAMGGAERSLLALSRWLWQRDISHHLVVYVDHVGIEQQAAHPLTVVQLLPEMRPKKKVAAMRRYFTERTQPPAPLLSGYQAAMHAGMAGIQGAHCLMHDTPDLFEDADKLGWKQKARRWVSNRMVARELKSGGKTIVTSEHLREETKRLFNVDADIARMGGLTGAEAFRLRPVEKELRLLSVSRVEANKRIDWMLRALASMESGTAPLSGRVDWTLDVVGRGTQTETLRKLATSLGLEDRVKFNGYLSDDALLEIYAKAHLFLMPAVQGYGIPAVEALARGLPVLLHRESGVSDILLNTPWATVIEGAEDGMLPGLRSAVKLILAGTQLTAPPPELPTEDSWAERVATLCGWV